MSSTAESRAQQKRKIILETALGTFARDGFHAADVQKIADVAGVGKGTVYRHFENKEGLFLATVRHCLDQLASFVEGQVGDEAHLAQTVETVGTPEVLRRIALACAAFYQQCPAAIEIMLHERAEFRDRIVPSHLMFRAESRQGFDAMLHRAIGRGELRDVNVTEASNAYGDLLFGSIVNGHLEGPDTDLISRVGHAVDLFLRGFLATDQRPADSAHG